MTQRNEAPPITDEKSMVTIKKYSNRRLYDTSESCYITLEELAFKIRDGDDVKVIDAKTDRDLTQQVLAQIILESRGAAKLLPVPLLMRLIRMGEDNLAEFFGQYMSWALELYLKFKQGYRTVAPLVPFSQVLGQNNPLAQLFGPTPPWRQGEQAAPWRQPHSQDEPSKGRPDSQPSADATASDVAALREEMRQLKAMMLEMSRAQADDP